MLYLCYTSSRFHVYNFISSMHLPMSTKERWGGWNILGFGLLNPNTPFLLIPPTWKWNEVSESANRGPLF